MIVLFYILGNWFCLAAASIVLYHYLYFGLISSSPLANRRDIPGSTAAFDYFSHDSDRDLQISKDMLAMLFISALARVYWSVSPDAIYSDEGPLVQVTAILDLSLTPLVWGLCVLFSNRIFWDNVVTSMRESGISGAGSLLKSGSGFTANERASFQRSRRDDVDGEGDAEVHPHMRYVAWPKLTFAAFLVSLLLFNILPSIGSQSAHAFPKVEFFFLLNLIIDGFALFPQIMLVTKSRANSESHANREKASNFLGLLCLGRLTRMIFWLSLWLFSGVGQDTGKIWFGLIPDALHCLILSDFVVAWAKKIRVETVQPWMRAANIL